jgi:hypothetical protein
MGVVAAAEIEETVTATSLSASLSASASFSATAFTAFTAALFPSYLVKINRSAHSLEVPPTIKPRSIV